MADGSDAQMRGIQTSDVPVGWGDTEINCIDDLEGRLLSAGLPISVLRKQKPITL